MVKLEEIKSIIETLSDDEYIQLRQWFLDKDWVKWDMQIDEASIAGKLDFLINEALQEYDRLKEI